MKYQLFFKQIFFVLTLAFLTSCDQDAEEIGANIVGDDNFSTLQQFYDVSASNLDLGPVDSGSLDVNLLGVYDNPVFGKTTANFAAELLLATENPTIDLSLFDSIKSVTLYVPYYSTVIGANADGSTQYRLDSLSYSDLNKDAKLNLKIYRSKKYLSDPDPISKLYSNNNALFESTSSESDLLFDSGSAGFGFSSLGQKETTINEDTGAPTETDVTPRMKIELDKQKFKEYLFSSAAQGQLQTNAIFRQYFRGLYFNVSLANPAKSVMAMLNFKGGKVVINYTMRSAAGSSTLLHKTMVLNMNGKTINLFEKTNTLTLTNPEQKLVLNNGNSSMAVIDLFPNDADIDDIKTNRRLINDASLTFYVDRETMGTNPKDIQPERIYLYNLATNAPILDYYYDATANSTYPALSKTIHGGILEVDQDKRGIKYKIRLTNHIISLFALQNPAENAKLGLVVTENINNITTKILKTEKVLNPALTIKEIPQMSVVQPFSTVLWGSNIPADSPNYDKRLKLEIIYSKPN